MPFCPDCGYKMSHNDKFCYRCGKLSPNEFGSIFEKGNLKIDTGEETNGESPGTFNVESIHGLQHSGHSDKEKLPLNETESEILGLPYTWTIDNLEITLLGLVQREGYEINNPLDNKKQYEVIIKFKNLLKRSNKIINGSQGFESLSLKTDVGNIWDIKENLESLLITKSLDPEEEFIRNETTFEIRKKEIPEYLLAEIFGKKYEFSVKLIPKKQYDESDKNYQFR